MIEWWWVDLHPEKRERMSYRDEFKTTEKDAYWSLPRVLSITAAVLLGFYILGFLATGGDLAIYRFWAPKQAAAQREVFKQSQSHVEGQISYLSRLERDYKTAETSAQREALRGLIIEESRKVDFNLLPTDLQLFVNSIR
jgi:hypothetical protein